MTKNGTLVDEYFQLKKKQDELNERVEAVRKQLLAALEKTKSGRISGILATALLMEAKRSSIDRDALKTELMKLLGESVADRVISSATKTTNYPVIRLQEARIGSK
ncbi:MAG: hypothetical protein QXE52_08080 [Candidatus Caldarchaeum sp.]